jgi:hypothetical protein
MQDIKSGDARAWETFVHESVTRQWAWANFLSADVAPWIEVQVQPANDEAKFAKAQKDGAEAYEVWLRTGAPVDVGPFMQKLGTPIDEKRLDAMRKKQDKELSLVEQEAA